VFRFLPSNFWVAGNSSYFFYSGPLSRFLLTRWLIRFFISFVAIVGRERKCWPKQPFFRIPPPQWAFRALTFIFSPLFKSCNFSMILPDSFLFFCSSSRFDWFLPGAFEILPSPVFFPSFLPTKTYGDNLIRTKDQFRSTSRAEVTSFSFPLIIRHRLRSWPRPCRRRPDWRLKVAFLMRLFFCRGRSLLWLVSPPIWWLWVPRFCLLFLFSPLYAVHWS